MMISGRDNTKKEPKIKLRLFCVFLKRGLALNRTKSNTTNDKLGQKQVDYDYRENSKYHVKIEDTYVYLDRT